jgi:predicted nuclease with RNAse H fold
MTSERWAGIDVGGPAKGFHLAVVDHQRVVAGPTRIVGPADAVGWLAEYEPALVAVDSPIAPALEGRAHRDCELRLARELCRIRWTPDARSLRANPAYYGWILNGLELYEALRSARLDAVECFPTASWTRLAGPRAGRTRAHWTGAALPMLRLAGIPPRTNQDQRDALAAAVTARAHGRRQTACYGDIVVPVAGERLATSEAVG